MICNIVRIVHRMIKQGHQFTDPLDIKSVGDESLENPEVVPIAQKSEEIKIEPVQVCQSEVNIESKPEVEPEVKPQIISEAKQEIFETQKVDPPVEINQVSPKVEQKVPVYEETKLPEYEESKLLPDKQVGISMDIPPIVDEYQPYIDYNQHQPSINEYVPPPYNGQGYYEDRRRERVSYYDQMPRGPSNRERSPAAQMRGYSEENTIKYVRARNLPPNCDKSGIIEFFSSIPIAYANIALVYDQTGRFCQEAILALNNLNDQIEAVYQSGRYIFNYQVFVEEAAPAEWEHAQQTQKVFFNRDERILVRMRGLPYTIKKEEVLAFFAGYDVVPDSVIIGEMGNGKKTGEGVILFKSEEEAQRAVNDKNGSSIGRRWIELYLHPYSHFHNFFQAQHHEEFVYLNKFITEENKFRTLRLRGLPFNVSKKEILNFFKEFPLSDSDVIFEIKEGRATGRALVFMMDPITAVRAVQRLDKEYIGNRYIELDQVSNLPHEF